MLRIAFAVLLIACTEHGRGGPFRPPLPDVCIDRCIVDEPVTTADQCCDSVTCWFDEDTGEWQFVFCDAPPEPLDPCTGTCASDQICVEDFDGGCQLFGAHCEPRTTECPDNACTTACDALFCGEGLTCSAPPCGTEFPAAVHCYGP